MMRAKQRLILYRGFSKFCLLSLVNETTANGCHTFSRILRTAVCKASILIMRTPETELTLITHDPIQSRRSNQGSNQGFNPIEPFKALAASAFFQVAVTSDFNSIFLP